MEYVQMTLTDWMSVKSKLQAELTGIKQSFVKIGYYLRRADESKAYEMDGYKSVAEWAKAEYGMSGSTVSRFMSINKEYSLGGYSETIQPEYLDFKRSQLEEMLKLPGPDREMIRPETQRQDIRDLKQFNQQEAPEQLTELGELVKAFFETNRDILKQIYKQPGMDIKEMIEAVCPSGNRSYRKGTIFLMMYTDKICLKRFGQTPEDLTWQQFFDEMRNVYGEELEEDEPAAVESGAEEDRPEVQSSERGAEETVADGGRGRTGATEDREEVPEHGENTGNDSDKTSTAGGSETQIAATGEPECNSDIGTTGTAEPAEEEGRSTDADSDRGFTDTVENEIEKEINPPVEQPIEEEKPAKIYPNKEKTAIAPAQNIEEKTSNVTDISKIPQVKEPEENQDAKTRILFEIKKLNRIVMEAGCKSDWDKATDVAEAIEKMCYAKYEETME